MKKIIDNKKIRVVVFAVVLLAGLGIGKYYLSINKTLSDSSSFDRNIMVIQTKKVLPETVTQDISVSAVTEAFSETDIFPETNGKIFTFYYSEGEYIEKGQILAKVEIDQSLLTNFENAKTNLEIAEESQKNTKKLQKQLKKDAEGTSSEKATKKTAELANDVAEGQTKVAQGQVDYVQSQLNKYSIKVPIGGFVSRINLDNGDLATITMPIATISDSRKIKIEVAVTEFDISKIASGQEVRIKLDSCPNDEFVGKIYYVSSVADSISKKFPVKIQLENTDRKIKAGMIAQVNIDTVKQKNALIIPRTAVFMDGNMEKIYLVDDDSKIKIVAIKTEIFDDKLKVVEGLLENKEIVVNGNYKLEEGEKIISKNIE